VRICLRFVLEDHKTLLARERVPFVPRAELLMAGLHVVHLSLSLVLAVEPTFHANGFLPQLRGICFIHWKSNMLLRLVLISLGFVREDLEALLAAPCL